jgi:hypothetical protein
MIEITNQKFPFFVINPDAIEKLYSDLVKHFIEEEIKHWKQIT